MLIVSSEFSIPDGYRFRPSREEILCRYLKPAINGEPLSSGILIEVDIYGENREPWNIFNKDAKQSFWVFTKLKKKSKSRFDRIAGCGCWLGQSIKEIKDASGQLLGFDKYFTFTCKKDKSSCQGNGHWIMHEFSLKDEGLSEYAICEIRNKDVGVSFDHQEDEVESNNKKRKSLDVFDEEISVPSMKKVCRDHQQTLQTMITSPDFADYIRPEEPITAVTSYQQQNTGDDFADYIRHEEPSAAVTSYQQQNTGDDFADYIRPEEPSTAVTSYQQQNSADDFADYIRPEEQITAVTSYQQQSTGDDFADYIRPKEPSTAVRSYQQQNSGELPNRMQTTSSPDFTDFIGPEDIIFDVDGILNGLDLEEVILFKKR
ncbi:hypothetical protein CRYUN_Cryun40dG0078000 [Craigia yunnanensis]